MRLDRLARAIVPAVVLGWLSIPADVPALAGGPPEPTWTAEQRKHWSFLPPKRPEVPTVRQKAWVRNPIDAFILNSLEEFGLAPAPEADRTTLIRRLCFDLTGLPPTTQQVDAFLADRRPDAYQRLVDQLLDSPRYGERWARSWLDLARYAESDGFKSDVTRPLAWRYRDWVISALNRDLPYDRFVQQQLAGDEFAPDDPTAFIATGFNRNWPFEDNNKVPGLNRQLMLEDMTDTTASVFLGLTVACARCHDHKYDPISQKDYYRFQALFAASTPRDDYTLLPPFEKSVQATIDAEHEARLALIRHEQEKIEEPYREALVRQKVALLPDEVRKAYETEPEERTAEQEDLLQQYAKEMKVAPKAMEKAMSPGDRRLWAAQGALMDRLVRNAPPDPDHASGMTDTGQEAPPVFLLRKGNYASPGEEVAPGFLSVLGSTTLPNGTSSSSLATSGRRKALAEWLTRPDHPLTARVMVNRLWLGHFGRGIVATPSDFGTQGAEPSHPELLDWLATEFIARGWSLKAMHRLMVSSATYRQSSTPPARTLKEDPDNLLFGRMFRRRLEGEAVRDALLMASGQLDLTMGGPSVFPDLPPGVVTRGGWTRSPSAAQRNRRSVYVFVRRNLKYPLFDAFDFPDTNVTCPERNVSVNAPQALMLLNSELIVDQAKHLAGRILSSAADRSDLGAVVDRAYRLALSRAPSADERARGVAFLEEQPALLSARAGGESDGKALDLPIPMPDAHDPAQGAALVDYCHVLLNLNEFVFVD